MRKENLNRKKCPNCKTNKDVFEILFTKKLKDSLTPEVLDIYQKNHYLFGGPIIRSEKWYCSNCREYFK